jgi:pimeloyl-ACP methyl ester carboxylesterase
LVPKFVLVRVCVLGAASIVTADGTAIRLERKTRELLTVLALRAPGSVNIDELERLLWDDPPPSAMKTIRSHLSRLRTALRVAATGGTIERTGRDAYRLLIEPGQSDVDVVVTYRARARALLADGRPDSAAQVLADARNIWHGDVELPDTTSAAALAQWWQRERKQLIEDHLEAVSRGSHPTQALGELESLIVADPHGEPVRVHHVRALQRSGRQTEASRACHSARRALAEVGLEPGAALLAIEAELLAAPPIVTPQPSPPPESRTAPAEPVSVRYAASGIGSTAYTRVGQGDNDVVIMNPAMITIDGLTDEPHMLSALRALAADARVTCFDRRGIGLSDPLSADGDPFEDWVTDLAAVLDALGAERPTILANFDTGLVAIEFAARYPDRVGSLILVHCFARFVRGDDYPFGIDLTTADALVDDSVNAGPTGTSIDTLAFVAPSVATDPAFRGWWDLIGRRAASPQTARTILRVGARTDLRHRLAAVTAPTLLLHRRSCLGVDIGHAHYLLEHLPRARLEVLTGTDSLWFTDASDLLDRAREFISEPST